jgi:hypothetical protein
MVAPVVRMIARGRYHWLIPPLVAALAVSHYRRWSIQLFAHAAADLFPYVTTVSVRVAKTVQVHDQKVALGG